jgi:ribokinase
MIVFLKSINNLIWRVIFLKTAMVFGSFITDLMSRAPHLPEPGETVKGSVFKLGPGGKGFNQAVAAHRAGGAPLFCTKIGNDTFGKI